MKSIIKNETQWHQLRAVNIGSSDVAALFDLSPYQTRFELWHLKSGNISDNFTGNIRTRYGQKLEAVIAECVAEETGWQVIEEGATTYYTSDRIEGMGCTPDRIVLMPDCGHPGVLEIKNIDRMQFARAWADGEPPIYYQLQLQHQLACTGHKWGAIAAMVGGNDLKIYTFDRHDDTIGKIEDAVKAFWQSVRDDSPPLPFAAGDYDVVKQLYPSATYDLADLTGDNELPILCAELCVISEGRKDAEKREGVLKAQILNKVGEAERAKCNGFIIKAAQIIKNMKAKEAHVQKYRQLTVKELAA